MACSFYLEVMGRLAPTVFYSSEITRMGFSGIHNFCPLCCETIYLISIADLERWLNNTVGELTYFQGVVWVTAFTDYTSKQNKTKQQELPIS